MATINKEQAQKALDTFNEWLKNIQVKYDATKADYWTFNMFLQAENIRNAIQYCIDDKI